MRAKDLNTLETFLAEYGGDATSAGAGQQQNVSSRVGKQTPLNKAKSAKDEREAEEAGLDPKKAIAMGDVAKANLDAPASDDDVGISPGSTTASNVPVAPEVNQATGAQGLAPTKAGPKSSMTGNRVSESDTLDTPDIDVGDEVKVGKFKNRKATVTGFEKDSHGQPVLKTDKGDHQLFKPRVSKLEPVPESDKLKKFKPKGAFGRSGVKSTLKKKLPTGRLLKEADVLFEIDYNSKDVIKQALKGPVTCGFEAEMIFKNINSFSDDDSIYGDYDSNMSTIDRINNSDNIDEIRDLYKKTLMDYSNTYGEAFYRYQMSQMSKDLEDEDWMDDYVNYAIDDNDIADYRQEALKNAKADDPDEYEERLEWDNAAWGRELAELKHTEDMQEYWLENMDDLQLERLINRFEDNRQYGIDSWLDSNMNQGTYEWDQAHELLGDPQEDSDEENPKQIAYNEVEQWLEAWVSKSSSLKPDIEVGDYHATTGHDGWRIEEDGSLDGDGQGFEIISPVYETPADLLKDLQSFIEYANAQGDVETNRSTGLHITMSYDEESDMFPSIARTKMLVLSGSDWVAKAWGREFNSFTKQTTVQVLNALKGIATGNASKDNIKTMDDMIERFDDANLGAYGKVERGSSLNFKNEKNDKGNNLVEFRAAGNNYLPEIAMIKKDVVRNSALVQATYDPDSHNKEFAKKMYKMLQMATEKEFDSPDVYDQTRGLTPDDVYRQNTGDRDAKVDDQELTKILMKYAHRDIQPATKTAISDFYRSIRTYNQFKNAPKDEQPQKQPPAPEPEELKPLWEDAEEDAAYDQKLRADIANNLAHLMTKLALSPNADKMPAKEVMAVRRLLKQHNLQLDSVLSELETAVRNDNIPDARDKQDISRIYRRAGRLLGKDLTSHMPKGKDIVVPPNKVMLTTYDAIKAVSKGADPMEEFIFMDKLDWQYALDVCEKINQAYDQWQVIDTNPNRTEQEKIDAQIEFSKKSHAGADLLWKRSNLDVDKTTGVGERRGKPDYVPFKNGERLINAKDILPQLEKAGVTVRENKQRKNPDQGRLVGESQHLEEGMDGTLKAFVIAGVILFVGADVVKGVEERREWKTAYEQIKTQDPAKADEIKELMGKYQMTVSNKDLSVMAMKYKKDINTIIDNFEQQNGLKGTVRENKQRSSWETLMNSFESKPLQEQLNLLGKLDKQKIDEAHTKMFVTEESVPDKRKVSILNQLFSEHFPASDIKKQMEAFSALPIPQMIDDFRSVQRDQGRDGCCRQVLCHYVRYIHPSLMHMIDTDFCDGKTSAPKDCEPCNEAWVGDTKIKKTGQWSSKTIAELQKLASALRKKESRTAAEQSKLKQINFAIRSKRDWKGGTKESISESRGVTGRAPGDKYVSAANPNDVLTMVDVKVIAPDEGAYGSAEELENAIETVLPAGANVIQDNKPSSSSLAAIVAELTDPAGNPQFWIRYIQRVPDQGVDKLWKTLRGYKYGKGAAEESLPIKPTDLVNDEQFKTPANLEKEITRNLTTALGGSNADLIPVMQDAMKQARAGTEQPIPGAAPYYNVLVKYGGEYLGPMALIDGNNQKGNTPEALDAYGLKTLKGSTVMFPQDSAFALVDSFIKAPNGQEIGISSKAHTGGGAASSLNGVSNQLTDEIRAEFPQGSEIIDILGTTPARVGPLRVAKMYGLINDKDIQEIATMSKKTQDPAELRSPRLRKLLAKVKPDTSKPGYRVYYHLLAGIVETIIPLVNAEPEFKGAMIAALNNNKFLQLMAKGKKSGNDVILDYYTKFPAVYEGAPKLSNKGYYSTGQNGRLGFKLKK